MIMSVLLLVKLRSKSHNKKAYNAPKNENTEIMNLESSLRGSSSSGPASIIPITMITTCIITTLR